MLKTPKKVRLQCVKSIPNYLLVWNSQLCISQCLYVDGCLHFLVLVEDGLKGHMSDISAREGCGAGKKSQTKTK